MYLKNACVAYAAAPDSLEQTIETAMENVRARSSLIDVKTWRNSDVCGHFIAEQILDEVERRDVLIADITILNFNVIYEIGFAIGKQKPVYIIRNDSLQVEEIKLTELGIFDTLGYETYHNSNDLTRLLLSDHDISPIDIPVGRNSRAPLYLIVPKIKTDFVNRTSSRINKARLFERKFDPNEQARLAAFDAIENVAESYGVVIPLLAPEIQGARFHNLRAAFVAGLAGGLERVHLIIQEGNSPVPIDYRDLAKSCYRLDQVDTFIADFVVNVTEHLQSESEVPVRAQENFLQSVNFGASTAENELRDLPGYYLETDAYLRVARGEARVVVGRKGSGKTAIFYRVRERIRRNRSHVVLDLKLEGYQLRKLRDSVLRLIQEGSQEHLVMAFWEYVLLLELCSKLLEMDRERQLRDPLLLELYYRLSDNYGADEYITEGDFSDRMNRLASDVAARYASRFGPQQGHGLSEGEITDLLYRHDLSALRQMLHEYLAQKGKIWILFDNIDKGWPSHGIEQEDILIIRTLLEATRKIERDLSRHSVETHAVVFLRNDVYELLIEQTPDRGKEARVAVDWSDSDLLREVVRLRLVSNELQPDLNFEEVWHMVFVPYVGGEESSQYLIDRCLMRPRALIDLINHCRSVAVNLRHARIEEDDIRKGLEAYSNDLVSEINLEIRDVIPEAENVLYHFIGERKTIGAQNLEALLLQEGMTPSLLPQILNVLYWHGVLGLVWPDGHVEYIYDAKYNMRLFAAQMEKLKKTGLMFQMNPAFWPALGVT
ncbi:MAG: P-loop ATPase, Sll1717 family [Gammaproteobacteria bacterium]